MYPFWKYLVVVFCVVSALALTGCGGGGGASGPIDPGPTPGTSQTFSVAAGQAVDKTVGNVGISIPTNAFTQNSTVTVELKQPLSRPPNDAVSVIGNEVTITSTVKPAGPIIVTSTAGTLTRSGFYYYLPISRANGIWKIVGEVALEAKATLSPNQFVWDGVKSSLSFVLTKLLVSPPDSGAIGPRLLSGTGTLGDGSVLLVHGINSQVGSMRQLATALVASGRYKNAWGFNYDWRMSTESAATELGATIDSVGSSRGRIDLFGHSRGTLICRYAMEVLGKTKPINHAIFACGPNKGTGFDTAIETLTAVREDFINTPLALDFPPDGMPAIEELTKNSNIVQTLSTDHGQRGIVDYFLIGGTSDLLVSMDSAQAQGVSIDAMTAGFVRRNQVSGGHGSPTHDPGCISQLISIISQNTSPAIEVVALPKIIDAVSDGWEVNLTVNNQTPYTVRLDELTIDCYDRHGAWYGCQWYDPNAGSGNWFPLEPAVWGRTLRPGQVINQGVHVFPDTIGSSISTTADKNKAKMFWLCLTFTWEGRQCMTTSTVVLHYGAIYPSEAQVRSLLNPTRREGGIGLVQMK